ncbi:mRNA 3'-end processing factor [Halorarum halophilum]|uniref:mRNA 3'-end processing factor n=1 Tax=Halorarum halophilum TaxID=2743090 RepID=A0A7D5GGT5_9EURY|nr:mRNA 3'-end processing factor [Halobaculum halophilum]QLG27031.1 mRNA 3'-end processing factor [Halobaculum halophilum]
MTDTGVSLRDGIHIDLSDGTRVVADASSPSGDVNVLTHAHGDHLFRASPGPVVCSPATADIARHRRTNAIVEPGTDPRVELVSAGHVAGSTAAVVTDPDGTRYCYTGDVSTRDRLYLDGFDPPDVDVLVVESTYGRPEYVLPSQAEVEGEINDWLDETMDCPVLLFGYSLGRAQKLQVLAEAAGRDRVFVTDGVAGVNAAVEPHVDATFGSATFGPDVDLGPGDALVLPRGRGTRDLVARLRDERDAVTAGFSGWAVDESFRYRGDYDATFPLTDHCDFRELCELVEAANPDRVYTTHGFTDELAIELTRRGFEATALRKGQAMLGDF